MDARKNGPQERGGHFAALCNEIGGKSAACRDNFLLFRCRPGLAGCKGCKSCRESSGCTSVTSGFGNGAPGHRQRPGESRVCPGQGVFSSRCKRCRGRGVGSAVKSVLSF